VSSKRSRISLSEAGQVQVDAIERDFQSHWGEIEQAYGRPLPEEVRKSIVSAVHALMNDGAIEQNALFATAANERIREIRHSARQLKSTLNTRTLPDHNNERALLLLIGKEIKRLGPPRSDLRESAMMAGRIVIACDTLLAKLTAGLGFQEGEAWKHFIRVMTEICDKAGLPTGASQSRDKRSDNKPSPFVAFISEIQKRLPSDIRRHDRADPTSLAKKINEARPGYRDRSVDALLVDVSHPSQWQTDPPDAAVDPAIEREIADVWDQDGPESS
jgi:hypothetical protein